MKWFHRSETVEDANGNNSYSVLITYTQINRLKGNGTTISLFSTMVEINKHFETDFSFFFLKITRRQRKIIIQK